MGLGRIADCTPVLSNMGTRFKVTVTNFTWKTDMWVEYVLNWSLCAAKAASSFASVYSSPSPPFAALNGTTGSRPLVDA